jgi:hypothetical protein
MEERRPKKKSLLIIRIHLPALDAHRHERRVGMNVGLHTPPPHFRHQLQSPPQLLPAPTLGDGSRIGVQIGQGCSWLPQRNGSKGVEELGSTVAGTLLGEFLQKGCNGPGVEEREGGCQGVHHGAAGLEALLFVSRGGGGGGAIVTLMCVKEIFFSIHYTRKLHTWKEIGT